MEGHPMERYVSRGSFGFTMDDIYFLNNFYFCKLLGRHCFETHVVSLLDNR